MGEVDTKKAGEHAVRFCDLVGEIAGEYDARGDVREILYGMAAAFKSVCEDLGADACRPARRHHRYQGEQVTPAELRALLAKHPMPTPHMVHADLAIAAARALPALLDVVEAAKTVAAGARNPQAVPPTEWYAAIEAMAVALDRMGSK